MGIGDWGLGIGDWAPSPIPHPPSPIPHPPFPFFLLFNLNFKNLITIKLFANLN